MQRVQTQRIVELESDEDIAHDAFQDGFVESVDTPSMLSPRENSLEDSMCMTLTPHSTNDFDRPVLVELAKPSSTTDSAHSASRQQYEYDYAYEEGPHLGKPDTHKDGGGGSGGGDHPDSAPRDSQRGRDTMVHLHYETPSVFWVTAAAVVGVIAGLILTRFNLSDATKDWIGALGTWYTNVMDCLAVPLVFTTVTICVAHLFMSTKTHGVMYRMAFMFIVAAFLSSLIALGVSMSMASMYKPYVPAPLPDPSAAVALQCPNKKFINASGLCSGAQLRDAQIFVITNVTGISLTNQENGEFAMDVSLASQIVAFFTQVFQENIASAFAQGELLGVIVFASFIGAGLIISQDYPSMAEQTSYLFLVLRQMDVVLEIILNWFMRVLPLTTVSSMTFAIVTNSLGAAQEFKVAGYLSMTLHIAVVAHFTLVLGLGYYLLVRKNPFTFYWYLLPAVAFMFASNDFVATIPVMMRSVESSKQVSRTLAQFAVSAGMTLSLCGTAAYFVVSCVFLAHTSGLEKELTAARAILLVVVSTLSSLGVPQVPGASVTYVATIWRVVFNRAPPSSFPLLIATHWITTRIARTHNITVVAFIARVIAEQLDETAEDEEDRTLQVRRVDSEMGSQREEAWGLDMDQDQDHGLDSI